VAPVKGLAEPVEFLNWVGGHDPGRRLQARSRGACRLLSGGNPNGGAAAGLAGRAAQGVVASGGARGGQITLVL